MNGKIVEKILNHICIICSIALLAVQILDWYNPFMDFMGHSIFLLYLLCVGTLLLGTERLLKEEKGSSNLRGTSRKKH